MSAKIQHGGGLHALKIATKKNIHEIVTNNQWFDFRMNI